MRHRWLLLALLVGAGCATRGTIKELGRPEFAGTIPEQVELTLIEPKVPGQFQAYPRGAGQGDYHCRVIMEEAPHFEGENVVFVKRARPMGDQKLKVFDVVAWPLLAKHVIRFKEIGVDELILVMQMGTVPHELVMESLRTFAEKVMPHFG